MSSDEDDTVDYSNKRYSEKTTDYRRGFVEGQAGERDAFLLFTGCDNVDEYDRGFVDGMEMVPTLDDWLYAWESAVEAGQSTITRDEATRRYYERYPEAKQ